MPNQNAYQHALKTLHDACDPCEQIPLPYERAIDQPCYDSAISYALHLTTLGILAFHAALACDFTLASGNTKPQTTFLA